MIQMNTYNLYIGLFTGISLFIVDTSSGGGGKTTLHLKRNVKKKGENGIFS